MNLDPILALLQVSTALGILYLALPTGRYRSKLFQGIVEAFKGQDVDDKLDDDIPPSLLKDRTFNEPYQKIAMWREELPDAHDEELDGTSARLFPRMAGRNPEAEQEALPAEYKRYKANTDVHWCLATAVVLPILTMVGLGVSVWWDFAACGEMVTHAVSGLCAAAGLVCVGWHVKRGRRMVGERSEEFRAALNDVVSAIARHRAEQEFPEPP